MSLLGAILLDLKPLKYKPEDPRYEKAFQAVMGIFDPADSADIHNLAGNVWEWVADWYADLSKESRRNPTGPDTGEWRLRPKVEEYPRSFRFRVGDSCR